MISVVILGAGNVATHLYNAFCKTKNVSVSVDKNVNYYVDMKKVSKDDLESEVLAKVGSTDSPTITIRSDQDVEMKHVVFIMDIANRNRIKSTLAVKSK